MNKPSRSSLIRPHPATTHGNTDALPTPKKIRPNDSSQKDSKSSEQQKSSENPNSAESKNSTAKKSDQLNPNAMDREPTPKASPNKELDKTYKKFLADTELQGKLQETFGLRDSIWKLFSTAITEPD
jgi:hypothetical protein